MEFRNIFIANPAKLSIRDSLLVIAQARETTVAIEDISAILIESPQVTITARALEALATAGVTVLLADSRHMPAAQVLPMNQFSRQKKMLTTQIGLSKPLQKQLWQKIVCQKIRNQAECLRLCGCEGSRELEEMAGKVLSGDSGNVEASAAAFYFRCLFQDSFARSQETLTNAMLNYGYAIIRSSVARNLVMHGLEPCLGIHHHSELNQFNLADDMMEPFRPLVDLYVKLHCPETGDALTPGLKQGLFNLTNYLVRQNQKKYRVMNAVEQSVVSLSASFGGKKNLLVLPELLPLEQYRYD